MGGFRFAFEFGWGNHFKFSFTIGEPPTSTKIKSEPEYTKTKPPQEVTLPKTCFRDLALKPRCRNREVAVSNSRLFVVPPEIRTNIYIRVLVSSNPIDRPHQLLHCAASAMLNERKMIPDIDAAIVRTCRRVYDETMPILYGNNRFVFKKAEDVSSFERKILKTFPLREGLPASIFGVNLRADHLQYSILEKRRTEDSLSSAISPCNSVEIHHSTWVEATWDGIGIAPGTNGPSMCSAAIPREPSHHSRSLRSTLKGGSWGRKTGSWYVVALRLKAHKSQLQTYVGICLSAPVLASIYSVVAWSS